MADRRVLPRSFYDRPSVVVAPALLGATIESETPDGVVTIRLVEVEAYAGEDDAASHAWRGITPRTAVMYGRPGVAYVYFTYGMHWCVNVVCLGHGTAAAVLLRAGEVIEGRELALARRGAGVPSRRLASGPANLARALGIDGSWDEDPVTNASSRLRLRAPASPPAEEIVAGPRIGITRAVGTPWRFWLAGNPHVSGPRRTGG